MSETLTLTIPADEDGFILQQCPKCKSKFKLTVSDFQSDEIVEIWCPVCGLISESYWTDDVIELAKTKALNTFMDEVHSQFKELERKTKGKAVSIKAGKKPTHEPKVPVSKIVEPFVVVETPCCNKPVKLSYREKESVYYCPFCGGVQYAG